MTHMHWVPRQKLVEIPNDEAEVNTRDNHKCDGQAHDPDTNGRFFVYYESIKREPKIRGIYEGKTETRLISERFANAMGECEN
jgi:hypothetical protein